jgi:hypothetical protein
MGTPVFFIQECPTCGRSLQIRVEYLGKKLFCGHCRGRFVARDPANSDCPPVEADLLRRANDLLRSLDSSKADPTPSSH